MSRPRLISLALSPYNDFARWALDRSGIDYDEERKPLVLHTLASRRVGGEGTTPVLVTDEGTIGDSADISEWADEHSSRPGSLYPEGEQGANAKVLVKHFADDLGTQTRPLFWTSLIEDLPLASRLWSQGLSERAARVQPWVLRLSKPAVKRALDLKKDTVQTAPRRIREIFDEVGGYLERHSHLTGDEITAADLSFAAMAAPSLMPEEGHPTDYPDLSELTPPVAEAMRELRAHPAGEYALRMYREERAA